MSAWLAFAAVFAALELLALRPRRNADADLP